MLEQINAIAEKYAEVVYGIADYGLLDIGEKAVFSFLSTRYCIVEREKVMEACKFADVSYSIRNHITPLYREAMKNALEYLFGSSILNQNKECMKAATVHGWIARDKDGELRLYDTKPDRYEDRLWWVQFIDWCLKLDNKKFPDLTWEDEPRRVEITVKML